ncbi:hypothetical protein [Sciscionella marina]|uniref:hypothetical protein n=1 Tax=Sciscionella marina TaxID=508770 RepID=UPI0012F636FC|nr:hypothetical protein [Sciscionella marina]
MCKFSEQRQSNYTGPGDRITVTPFHEPHDKLEKMREIVRRWPIGEPDSDGWQRYTELNSCHRAGKGYVAILLTVQIEHRWPVHAVRYGVSLFTR